MAWTRVNRYIAVNTHPEVTGNTDVEYVQTWAHHRVMADKVVNIVSLPVNSTPNEVDESSHVIFNVSLVDGTTIITDWSGINDINSDLMMMSLGAGAEAPAKVTGEPTKEEL